MWRGRRAANMAAVRLQNDCLGATSENMTGGGDEEAVEYRR